MIAVELYAAPERRWRVETHAKRTGEPRTFCGYPIGTGRFHVEATGKLGTPDCVKCRRSMPLPPIRIER